jgi:uncharacterized damage-inducible protein DinB
MQVSSSALRAHIEYTAWATGRLLDAAATLSHDELTRDFGTADRSVIGTLAHTFAADRVWLSRLQATPFPGFVTDADRNLDFLRKEWPVLHDRWRAWARGLSDEDAAAVLAYHDLKGNAWQQQVWQVVLHVVNHATHHRGQVAGFIRSMGHVPPVLDLIAYYRQLN